jgi:hypothetical protein
MLSQVSRTGYAAGLENLASEKQGLVRLFTMCERPAAKRPATTIE